MTKFKFVLGAYTLLRNMVRSLALRSPLFERLLSAHLITLENFLPLYLFARMAPNPLTNGGLTIYHRQEDIGVTLPILFYGEYEPETSRLLKSLLQPGMTVVDLGAHIGYFTLLAARAVGPTGKVYAFEPVPSTFTLLIKNVMANKYENIVTIIPKAISDVASRGSIFLHEGSSVYAKSFPDYNGQTCVNVETISLDEFFGEKGWPQVHVVKMDIEGAELKALEGMRELSCRNAGLKLIIELNMQILIQTGISCERFLEAIQACGFSRFRVLWRNAEHLNIPKDIAGLAALARRVNINLLCEKL